MLKHTHSSCTVALAPTPTVIDRCLHSHTGNSDTRHMGVPPSCHVHLPMSPLWLRWRWQEQSGACQSHRKRLTHTHRRLPSLLQEQASYTLAVNPPVSMSAVINFPDFQCAGELPLVPAPSQVTGGSMLGMPASPARSIHPVYTERQKGNMKSEFLYVYLYYKEIVCTYKLCIFCVWVYIVGVNIISTKANNFLVLKCVTLQDENFYVCA